MQRSIFACGVRFVKHSNRYPIFPGKTKRIHWSFDDPAAVEGDDAAKLVVFRRVRGEISEQLRSLISPYGKYRAELTALSCLC